MAEDKRKPRPFDLRDLRDASAGARKPTPQTDALTTRLLEDGKRLVAEKARYWAMRELALGPRPFFLRGGIGLMGDCDSWPPCGLRLPQGLPKPAATPPLPPPDKSSRGRTSTSVWIEAEAKRLKAAGEIPDGVRKTDFARLLERRMRKAARSDENLRAVGYRYIKNSLRAWGLWPISSI